MRRIALFVVCIAACATSSRAAEATAEEAQRLLDIFHRYVGMPSAGNPDAVSVAAEGQSYRVTVDVKALTRPLEAIGFAMAAAETSFALTSLPDGTWRVADWRMPRDLTMHTHDGTIIWRTQDFRFDGIYDPTLPAFARFDQTIVAMSSETINSRGETTTRYGEQVSHGSAAAGRDGGIDVVVRQSYRDTQTRQRILLTPPPKDPSAPVPPPLEFTYGLDSAAVESSAEGLRMRDLMELWAFLVAHPSSQSLAAEEDRLKALLAGALPLVRRFEESGTGMRLRVQTPRGEFAADEIRGRLAGPTPAGNLQAMLALSGLAYPEAAVPAWAQALAPTEMEFGFALVGFDFEAALRGMIEELHVGRRPAIEPGRLLAALWLAVPEGRARLVLQSNRIAGPLLDLRMDGGMSFAKAGQKGIFRITATGLDRAVASLSGAAPDSPQGKALGFLNVAKMFGYKDKDGPVRYYVIVKEDGSIAINGRTVRPPRAGTLPPAP